MGSHAWSFQKISTQMNSVKYRADLCKKKKKKKVISDTANTNFVTQASNLALPEKIFNYWGLFGLFMNKIFYFLYHVFYVNS